MVTPHVVEIPYHRERGRTSPVAGQRDLVIASLLTQRGSRVRPPSATRTEGRKNPDGEERRRQR